ncbi:MAG: hypothetical protein PF961_06070 [Planctomycetota bacterium]|jgi:pyruvate-formate lyase|nr:hypothetical protein [Planctomycetota bacterium]
MQALSQTIDARLAAAQDHVDWQRAEIVVRAWPRCAECHPAERSAGVLTAILAEIDLDLETNPMFAGATGGKPGHIMTMPEYGWGADGQARIEVPDLCAVIDAEMVPTAIQDYIDQNGFGGHHSYGHLAVDLERVVHGGLARIIAACDEHAGRGDADAQARRRAMATACRAVIAWAQRYAEGAEQRAARESDPLLAARYKRMAQACRRVPALPARTLHEALQAVVLCHLAQHIEGHGLSVSLGLLDRVLAPFADEAVGNSPDTAELFEAFLLAIHANGVHGRFSKTQCVTIGGADATGRDCCNATSEAILRAFDAVRVPDPHVFLRWHPALNAPVANVAYDMLLRGVSMPLLVNDVPTVAGFERLGIATEDAWDYCVIGCNELGIPGRACETAMGPGAIHINVVHAALCEELAPQSLSQWIERYEMRVEQQLRKQVAGFVAQRDRHAQERPTPFTSALMYDTVERGSDCANGLRYRTPASYERGLSNAVDAMAAVDALVFHGDVSMDALRAALRGDWPDESLRQRFLAVTAWGNDDPQIDAIARRILDARHRAGDRVAAALGLPGLLYCHVVRSLHHMAGKTLGATADGRHAGEALGDSLGACSGRALAGPTAVLGSVLTLDPARDYGGGTNLNLNLNPQGMRLDHLRALVEGFFIDGGQELQIACVSAAQLRDAQCHPERHRDLLVRIAGFNARFVELSALEQQEIVARAEHVC